MAEPFTLYKLIILYMLDRVDFPLTNSQISSFLLDRGYTNYFTLQQAFSELEEANLVKPQTIRNTTKEYAVHCVIKEKESDLIDLTLTVPDKKQAEAMCKSWKNKCEMVYQFLMTQLS